MLSDITYRKFTNVIEVDDWEVETPSGYKDITHFNTTIPYDVWEVKLENGLSLKGADTHILINSNNEEVYIKDSLGSIIQTKYGPSIVVKVNSLGYEEEMYDLTIDSVDHTYYTSDILSHNTVCAAGYLLWYAMFVPDSTILVASKSSDDAKEIVQRIKFAYEELPDFIRAGVFEYNKHSITFDNGSRIISKSTTENTGRGMSITLVYLDEFAFINPRVARDLWTSLSPTLSTGGKCIITSTPSDDECMFAQIWFDANKLTDEYGNEREVGINGFKPIFATWRDNPERDQTWADGERNKIGEHKFLIEHECRFLSHEETLINPAKLSKLEGKYPIKKTGEVRWYSDISPNNVYVVALDPAMGTGGDNAAIQVYELPSLKQVVEWQHNRTPIEGQMRVLRQILLDIQACGSPEIYWSVETNSLGEAALVVIRDTGEDFFPGTMLHDPVKNDGAKRKRGFITTNKSKVEACSKLKNLIETERLNIQSKNLIGELKSFVARGNSFEARPGATDDLVSATLLVIRMMQVVSQWDEFSASKLSSNIATDDDDYESPMPFFFA
jgi:hypothetical protein